MALKAGTAMGMKESVMHTKEDRHKKQPSSNERAWAGGGKRDLTSVCNISFLNICYEQDTTRGTRGGKWPEATKAGQGDRKRTR